MLRSARGVRRLSAAAKRSSVRIEGDHGKYAHSLFNVAKENKTEERVGKELRMIAESVGKDNVTAALRSPVRKTEDWTKRTEEWLTSGKGKALADPTKKLVRAVMSRGDALLLPKVADAYQAILRDARGIVGAKVTTAIPMSAAQEKKLVAELKKRLDSDQTVELEKDVDPTILGGIKVVLGNQYCDLSAASRVRKYDEWLRSRQYEWFDEKVQALQKVPVDQSVLYDK